MSASFSGQTLGKKYSFPLSICVNISNSMSSFVVVKMPLSTLERLYFFTFALIAFGPVANRPILLIGVPLLFNSIVGMYIDSALDSILFDSLFLTIEVSSLAFNINSSSFSFCSRFGTIS